MPVVLVYAEQYRNTLRKSAIESLCKGRALASYIGASLDVIIGGKDVSSLASDAATYGADVIHLMDGPEFEVYNTEIYAFAVSQIIREVRARVVLMGHTALGRDLAPRVAERLEAGLASDCVDIIVRGGEIFYVRPIYAGKAFARVSITTPIQFATLRPNLFPLTIAPGRGKTRKWSGQVPSTRAWIEGVKMRTGSRPELIEADIVVSGGRGLGRPEGFALLEKLADLLGAAVGASRAAVDAGWIAQAFQVGQTGKVVSPSLYIACGISGAIQHIAGMGSSKYIAAVNKDPDANIFRMADYGIVANLHEAIPILIRRLEELARVNPRKTSFSHAAEPSGLLEKDIEIRSSGQACPEPLEEPLTLRQVAVPAFTVSAVDVDELTHQMEKIVSGEYVSSCLFEKVKNTTDVFPYEVEREKLPFVVVMPRTAEEISAILRYANERGIPVYPRGSGTSFTGAARYQYPGIVLNMFRMQGYEVFEDMMYFECEPGLVCNDLASLLEEKGYFLPFAPGSRLIATMGGLACNNTSAHINDACMGKPSDYVMGVEAVLPDGQIIKTGTKGIRRIAGTDLTKFFVGGDGLLGVITKLRMKLVPSFNKAYGIAVFDNLAALGRGVQRMYREKRPVPIFMEFMEYDTAKIGYDLVNLGDPGGSVIFFVNIGSTQEEAESALVSVLRSFKAENPLTLRAVSDSEEWKVLWGTREVIGSFLMQSTQNQFVSLEIVSNLRDLVDCLEEAKNFNKDLPTLGQLKNYLFGHIGSLTMHPGVVIPKDWDNDTKIKAINEKFQREMELNLKYATCGGEWGQFAKRTEFFKRMYGDVGYQFMTKIKQAIDPKNILNRGVLEGY